MNYWDLPKEKQEELDKKGVDYDLRACLEYNTQPFDISDIEKVLAVWVGENEGDDWRWILKLNKTYVKSIENKTPYVFLQGGCDYTGWDCQSGALSKFTRTKKEALKLSKEENEKVYDSLLQQINSSKSKTWRENKDVELNVKDLPKLP